MYGNIGEKIKGLAIATFIIETVAAVIAGIALWVSIEEGWCVLIVFCGPIVAWLSSLLIYGYGEIIDKLCEIERNTDIITKPPKLKEESTLKKEKKIIAVEENAVIIECPECGEELFFDKDMQSAECPYCGCNTKIK